jgi:hypothetical protein
LEPRNREGVFTPVQPYSEADVKVILWIVAIIFVIGLLTVTGVLKLVF